MCYHESELSSNTQTRKLLLNQLSAFDSFPPSLPTVECDKQEISDNKLLHSWVALQVFLEDAQKFRILRTMLMDEEMWFKKFLKGRPDRSKVVHDGST